MERKQETWETKPTLRRYEGMESERGEQKRRLLSLRFSNSRMCVCVENEGMATTTHIVHSSRNSRLMLNSAGNGSSSSSLSFFPISSPRSEMVGRNEQSFLAALASVGSNPFLIPFLPLALFFLLFIYTLILVVQKSCQGIFIYKAGSFLVSIPSSSSILSSGKEVLQKSSKLLFLFFFSTQIANAPN